MRAYKLHKRLLLLSLGMLATKVTWALSEEQYNLNTVKFCGRIMVSIKLLKFLYFWEMNISLIILRSPWYLSYMQLKILQRGGKQKKFSSLTHMYMEATSPYIQNLYINS